MPSQNQTPQPTAVQIYPELTEMKMKFGVMGSASRIQQDDHLEKARHLGRAIAQNQCITITGGCPGLPLAAAEGAKSAGGLVIGISPGLSLNEHRYKYESPSEFHDVLIFTGSGLMGREVVNIRTSDIVVIVGGSSGTLGELAIAYDEGKLIGVLTGTGGIADVVDEILAACNKSTGARVIYDSQPEQLVAELLKVYRDEHFRRPSCFCDGCPTDEEEMPLRGSERDPVCGMWVVPKNARITRVFGGVTYYFCSNGCAVRFNADPNAFIRDAKIPIDSTQE